MSLFRHVQKMLESVKVPQPLIRYMHIQAKFKYIEILLYEEMDFITHPIL